MDCLICMSSPSFGVQLKCKHIFCYLCVKGVVNSDHRKCPLCRQTIHKNVLKRPNFVRSDANSDRPSDAFNSCQWFYEGRKGTGFWAYDHMNGQILEQAFNSDQKTCEIVISGVVYCVDFVRQVQYRRDQPFRSRQVRRDLLSNIQTTKGIAGVSKHMVPNLFPGPNASPKSSSGQQIRAKGSDNEETEEPVLKKIKVEVKAEPDSTSG